MMKRAILTQKSRLNGGGMNCDKKHVK